MAFWIFCYSTFYMISSLHESSKLPELSFDRLQLTDQECTGLQRRNFGRFVAREATLDEEYWTAAWLRAEAHWESLSYMRHVDSHKRKYAEEARTQQTSLMMSGTATMLGQCWRNTMSEQSNQL